MSGTQQRPRVLFLATGGGTARLCQADATAADAGATYVPLVRTNPLRAAEPSLDLIVYATYLALTLDGTDAQLSLTCTLYMDGVAAAVRQLDIPATASRTALRYEIAWAVPVTVGGIEHTMVAPRGNVAQLEIAVAGALPAGDVFLDGVEMEVERWGETMTAEVA